MSANLAPEGAIKNTTPSNSTKALLNKLRRLQLHFQTHSDMPPDTACRAAYDFYRAEPSPSPSTASAPPRPAFSEKSHETPCKRMRFPANPLKPSTHSASVTQTPQKLADHPSKAAHQSSSNPISTDGQSSESVKLQQQLRKDIQNLDDQEKSNLCHNNLITPYMREQMLRLQNNVSDLFKMQYDRLDREGNIVTHQQAAQIASQQQGLLGCKHYARNCKLKAKCCGLFVSCRLCHDELLADDHGIDRFATEKVLCMVCLTEQDVGPKCVECKTSFAHYFCPHCRFYENTPNKNIYHCDRCNICRLGKGLGIDNYHCDICDACVSMESKAHHQCRREALHADCPVCRVYLFTSTEPVVYMRCGHAMHKECFEEYTAGRYQCPLCMRSLLDMKSFFEQIDEHIRNEPMPPEYDNKRSMIRCNDCGKKGEVQYHFEYHKCTNVDCGSYNTNVLYSFDVDSEAQAAGPEPVDQAPSQQLVAGSSNSQ